jgi:hypothetical protein
MNYFSYGEQDFIYCEICGNRAGDVHHIIYRLNPKKAKETAEENKVVEMVPEIKKEKDKKVPIRDLIKALDKQMFEDANKRVEEYYKRQK